MGGMGGLGIIAMIVISLLTGVNPGCSSTPVAAHNGHARRRGRVPDRRRRQPRARTAASSASSTASRTTGATSSQRRGQRYTPAKTVLFTGATQTGCGARQPASGPFYCPVDKQVYLDLSFFDELQQRFGAKGGPFAAGLRRRARVRPPRPGPARRARPVGSDRQGAESAVGAHRAAGRLPAGVWAHNAVEHRLPRSRRPTADIAEALDAAAAVGDDRIQRRARAGSDPESWTHGSSQQRQQWFTTGYRERPHGDLRPAA